MEISMEMDTTNRPDEWMIEQGMAGHKLPILDPSGSDTINMYPPNPTKLMKRRFAQSAIARNYSHGSDQVCRVGKYPEKKVKAHKLLTSQTFPSCPDFMFGPIPPTNPVLPGDDFKAWHAAIGGEMTTVADDSWRTVLREKHPDMLHLLQFPYNGEPPKRLVTSKAITIG